MLFATRLVTSGDITDLHLANPRGSDPAVERTLVLYRFDDSVPDINRR